MHYKSLFTVQVSINCYKLNVYSISFLVATPCLGYYSLCKCQFIVLVTINCLIVYTMSVWTSVPLHCKYLSQCLYTVSILITQRTSVSFGICVFTLVCLGVYIIYTSYLCFFLSKCLYTVSVSTLSTLCTSVSLYSEGLVCEIFMIWFPVYLSKPRDPVISASLCTQYINTYTV